MTQVECNNLSCQYNTGGTCQKKVILIGVLGGCGAYHKGEKGGVTK